MAQDENVSRMWPMNYNRVIATIMGGAIVGGFLFYVSVTKDLAVIQTQLQYLQTQMITQTSNRYTTTDAKRDKALTDQRLDQCEKSIQAMWKKIR